MALQRAGREPGLPHKKFRHACENFSQPQEKFSHARQKFSHAKENFSQPQVLSGKARVNFIQAKAEACHLCKKSRHAHKKFTSAGENLRKVEPERCEHGRTLSHAEEIFSQARLLFSKAELLFSRAGLLRSGGRFFSRIGRPGREVGRRDRPPYTPERSLALLRASKRMGRRRAQVGLLSSIGLRRGSQWR
jgi:hypothetical protein